MYGRGWIMVRRVALALAFSVLAGGALAQSMGFGLSMSDHHGKGGGVGPAASFLLLVGGANILLVGGGKLECVGAC